MTLELSWQIRRWPLREPFAISRGVKTEGETLIVTLIDEAGRRGWGESCGVPYAGETVRTMIPQVEAARALVQSGATREALLTLLPAGGARCAIDGALWDLEAKRSGRSVFEIAGVAPAAPVSTAYTIGIRAPDAYEVAARHRAAFAVLKLKVDEADPVAAVAAARRGAPDAAFIVDPNQAWSIDTLKRLAPIMADLGVVLLEQPIAVGAEAGLDGYDCPVSLCADELINHSGDLHKAMGRFDVINIKLDKTGGLTEALRLAAAGRAAGFELMVGCMGGSSLAVAPGMVLARQCAFVDLDAPLLIAEDWPGGMACRDGVMQPPAPSFWG
jgi:L-alanine-DL-glutamate epimerase-like enolase superfamily enzyme